MTNGSLIQPGMMQKMEVEPKCLTQGVVLGEGVELGDNDFSSKLSTLDHKKNQRLRIFLVVMPGTSD